jgi:hypothetical protein
VSGPRRQSNELLQSAVNPRLHASPPPHTSCPLRLNDNMGYRNQIQNGPHMGLPKLRVLRQNPSAPAKANRARDKVTQRIFSNLRYLGPHQGNPTSSRFVSESQSGSLHHAPLLPSGLAPSRPGSPDRDGSRMMCETTRPGFASEEQLPLLALMEMYIYPC